MVYGLTSGLCGMETWKVNDEGTGIKLTGKYTRTIKIYWLCFITFYEALVTTMGINHDWLEWYLFLSEVFVMLGVLILPNQYSKPFKVEVRSGWLYLRNKRIDVTRRIHQIKHQNENMITIRFNFLYQLNVMGDREQIDQVEEQLRYYR